MSLASHDRADDAALMTEQPLLLIERLSVDYPGAEGPIRVLDAVDLEVGYGERVALVGESGSGKSVTARAILRLDRDAALSGRVTFEGTDLLELDERAMRSYRGAEIGIVFQDPFGSLDPRMRIGAQVAEALRIRGVSAQEARRRALECLEELRVPRAADRLKAYPHELSGGMRQRVLLAIALIGEPKLLIADEATTALDVRVQARILELLSEISARRQVAVLLITHDFGVVAGFAERVAVMYSGRKVEESPVRQAISSPAHPYTRALLDAVPRIDEQRDRLPAIPGVPPMPSDRPSGCAFHPRCGTAAAMCAVESPALRAGVGTHVVVACHFADEPRDDPA